MKAQTLDLESLQREMAAAVMQPLTPSEDMRPVSVDGRDMSAVAASFIAPSAYSSELRRVGAYPHL